MAWLPEPRVHTQAELNEAATRWTEFAAEMDMAADTEAQRGDAEAAAVRRRRATEARQVAGSLFT